MQHARKSETETGIALKKGTTALSTRRRVKEREKERILREKMKISLGERTEARLNHEGGGGGGGGKSWIPWLASEIPSVRPFSRGMRGYIGKTRSAVGIFSASWRASSSPSWPVFFRRVGGGRGRRMIGRSLESCPLGAGECRSIYTAPWPGGSAWKCVANGAFFLLMSDPRATKVVAPDDPD